MSQNAGVLSTVLSGVVMTAIVVYAILSAILVKETRCIEPLGFLGPFGWLIPGGMASTSWSGR